MRLGRTLLRNHVRHLGWLYVARSAQQELSTIFQWPEHFVDRDLDDPDRDQLAGLSPHWFRTLLGIVGFAGQIPSFLLAPLAGVLVDRWNRHRLLIATQVLALLQSLALAVLALTGLIRIWQIIVLSVFQGLINAFDMPARLLCR